jgi:hypothetical protein
MAHGPQGVNTTPADGSSGKIKRNPLEKIANSGHLDRSGRPPANVGSPTPPQLALACLIANAQGMTSWRGKGGPYENVG